MDVLAAPSLTPDDESTSAMDKEGLFTTLKEWVLADIEFSSAWRTRARKNITFAEGPGQWEEDDKQRLRDEERPVVTFNKTKKFIRAICGIETNNRHEATYLPRELDSPGEVKANELLTAASEWMEDGCDAQRHQSRAFRDATTIGMGWTEGVIDYDDDPQGLYVETRVHPCEMVWDKDARDQNLTDAKRVARVRRMKLSDARNLIQRSEKFSDDEMDASWASDVTDGKPEAKTQEQKELREEVRIKDDPKREVTVVQIQWWEYEPYYYALDPETFQRKAMTLNEYAMINARHGAKIKTGGWPGVKMRRKVYKQAFLGSRVLQSGPCPFPGGFTFICMTWEPNDDGTWAGIVDDLRDPQTWSNKFFAQMMHIINSTAKGGIIAEADAFQDVEEAKRNYPRADGIVVVNPGTIQKGKIMAKPGQGVTAGIMNLIQITDQMFQEVTGINLEIMGLADRDQAGVLEAQRKQAAMTILATLFDSLAKFRQTVGALRLHYIQTVLADGRLIRIAGQDMQEAIPLIRDNVIGKYDCVVSDAPTSPNSKERVWNSIQLLLPPLMKEGMVTSEHILVLLDYVPGLPSKLVQTFRDMAKKPDPAKLEAADAAKRQQEAEIADKSASAQSKRAQAVLSLAKAGAANAQEEATKLNAVFDALGFGVAKDSAMMPDTGQPVMGPTQNMPPPMRSLPELGEGPPAEAAPVNEANTAAGIQLPGGLMNGAGG